MTSVPEVSYLGRGPAWREQRWGRDSMNSLKDCSEIGSTCQKVARRLSLIEAAASDVIGVDQSKGLELDA